MISQTIKPTASSVSMLTRQGFGTSVSRFLAPFLKDTPPIAVAAVAKKRKNEEFFPREQFDEIRGKVALVTGSCEGIGLRCVRELLKCGIKAVMMADSDEERGRRRVWEFSRDYGADRVAFIRIDSSSSVLLRHAFASTVDHYKGLDIVVNNIKFREKSEWEDQVDQNVKGIVLSTQLSLEFMGRHVGRNGGTVVNITSHFEEDSSSCPIFVGVQDFVVGFDKTVAMEHYGSSDVKVLTICKATFESIGCDLATVITKGSNGYVLTS